MITNSAMNLDDVVFFCDARLATNNVYNVTFAVNNYDTLYPDLYCLMKNSCKLCLLQQCSDYHCKFTFVTSLEYSVFFRQLCKVISTLFYIRKLQPNQLVLI